MVVRLLRTIVLRILDLLLEDEVYDYCLCQTHSATGIAIDWLDRLWQVPAHKKRLSFLAYS